MAIRTNWASGDVLTAADLNDTFDDARENASNLTSGTLPIARIADGAITAAKLGANSVETAKINAGAVTTAKIGDGQVTLAKLDADVLGDDWATPTLATGWEMASYDQPLRYKKIGNLLYLVGAVNRTGAALSTPFASTVTTLPVGFRPSARTPFGVIAYTSSGTGNFAHIQAYVYGYITSAGVVSFNSNDGPGGSGTTMTPTVAFNAVVVL